MDSLELRQLRYFVAVAEELHFGRAAERLQMAQPPLSRAIKDIERHLGVQLLVRNTRAVSLTAAGEVLLANARPALEAAAAATQRARQAGQSYVSIRLAVKADYDAGMLPRIIEAYERQYPGPKVEVIFGGRGEQITALREGLADVAIMPLPFDERGVDVEVLIEESRVVAIPADDPLAARRSLQLQDLTGRPLPDGSPAELGGTKSPPAPEAPTYSFAEIFSQIEIGSMVWFPPVSVAQRHLRPGIAYRPISELDPSRLVVAWPQTSRDPAVAALVRSALEVAAATATRTNLSAADEVPASLEG